MYHKESVLFCLIVCCLYAASPISLMAESGQVIQKVLAEGQRNLRPFTVKDNWEILWDSKGPSLSITLYRDDGAMLDEVATQKGRGSGSSHQAQGGEYYLQVTGTGGWTVTVVQLPQRVFYNLLALLLLSWCTFSHPI